MDFRKLSIDDKNIFDKYEMVNHGYYGAEYCFAIVYLDNAGHMEIHVGEDFAIIRNKCCGKRIYYPPLLKNYKNISKAIRFIEKHAKNDDIKTEVYSLSKEQAELIGDSDFVVEYDRADSDYIYSAGDLINLRGKKFHSKRNHITRFKNTYNFEFREYNEHDRDAVMQLYEKWSKEIVNDRTCSHENGIMIRAIDNEKELGLKIGVLYVDDKLAAFSVNAVDGLIGHTLIEKADKSFDGAYQAINQLTAERFFSNVKYVNRQDDIGIEGLRKAKLSYNPIMLIDKYCLYSK